MYTLRHFCFMRHTNSFDPIEPTGPLSPALRSKVSARKALRKTGQEVTRIASFLGRSMDVLAKIPVESNAATESHSCT